MKRYLTKIRNGSLKESEMQAMFDELSKDGWTLDNMCATQSEFRIKLYFVFSKEE